MVTVREHFNKIADTYDGLKKKNWYYYDNLKLAFASAIPKELTVLEVGCGTGDILAHLEPAIGVGIDVSEKMIAIAKDKHANKKTLNFFASDIADFDTAMKFDFIIMADVVEHLDDVDKSISKLVSLMKDDSTLLNTMANPIWEPALMLAEKFGMKMEEGPHSRISITDFKNICEGSGLKLTHEKRFLNIPKHIPNISDGVNSYCEKNKILSKFGFVVLDVFKKHSELLF